MFVLGSASAAVVASEHANTPATVVFIVRIGFLLSAVLMAARKKQFSICAAAPSVGAMKS